MIIVWFPLSEYPLTPPGHIRAYDVHTGKRRWIFHTIPKPGERGYETYQDKNAYKWVGTIRTRPRRYVSASDLRRRP